MSQTTRNIINSYFETGDRPTQQQFIDWLDSVVWYDENYNYGVKEYMALLTQSGTDAPVAVVLKNTTGGTMNYSWVSTGDYLLTANISTFFELKTAIEFGSVWNTVTDARPGLVSSKRNSDIEIPIKTFEDRDTPADGILTGTFIKITIFP